MGNGLNLEPCLDLALGVAPGIPVIDASEGVPTIAGSPGRVGVVGDPAIPPGAPNPHIFLSPGNAALMTANIARALAERDPGGAAHYRERLALFEASMDGLGGEVRAFRESRQGYSVLTTHNFLDYPAGGLGLRIVADIEPGPDVAPSPARLGALAGLIRENEVAAILLGPEADLGRAGTLARETGARVLVLDPATAGPAAPPVDNFQDVLRGDLRRPSEILPANAPAR